MLANIHRGHWHLKQEKHEEGMVLIYAGSMREAPTEEEMVFGPQLIKLIDELSQGNVYLDCGNVTYLQSLDLGKLVSLWKKLKVVGRRLILCNVQDQTYEIFEITRLTKLMEICRGGPP